MPETIWTTVSSPVGDLLLTGDGYSLDALHLSDTRRPSVAHNGHRREDDAFAEARTQLVEYFEGDRTTFELSLTPQGTPFQLRVWDALRAIPYAATASYGEVAAAIGSPSASRAVGLANGRNPIAIVIPCHRVIGADGSLVGYGGGLDRKRRLLELEAAGLARDQR
ncbi:MAG TPA: methylated-DNA--[protein]-cysteine S-methyltransferase [Acidimicrobiales bacterium]|jgi:methylated-DNA-[protein]-cysteine S-methyltransferase|nr:methylated-DNA--[protein]-cysteine S-methyltransferase [Acidimicrobiales bacterium]